MEHSRAESTGREIELHTPARPPPHTHVLFIHDHVSSPLY